MNLKKANLNNWYNNPPKWMDNLGDALSSVSIFALGYAAIESNLTMVYVFIVIGCFGIFFKKLFKND